MHFWLIALATCVALIISLLKHHFSYWQRKGIQQMSPNLLWGNVQHLKSLNHREFLQDVYDQFHAPTKVVGAYVYGKPVAVILDLDMVKSVLIKDFNKFTSRMAYRNDKDILSQHLFNIEGTLWRPLRQKFSPTFTSGKMKYMFATIKAVADEFAETFRRQLEMTNLLDICDLNSRFTIDVIGSSIFGFECNSLSAEFRQITRMIFGRKNFNIRWQLFKHTYVRFMKFLGHKRYPQRVEDFFRRVVREGIVEREKHNIVRNDFVNLVLQLRKSGDMNLSFDQIAAQFFVFFSAGYETSATTMTCVLFELARHKEIQNKLRQEIQEILEKHDNNLTYEAVMEMKFLEAVLKETLRLYTPVPFLQRVATEQATLDNITFEKGTEVYIPSWAIHHDPNIYHNPNEFCPERFTALHEDQRHPQSFLAFGDGPRNCIGLRFGSLQSKVGLISLLSKFKFSHVPETCKEIVFSKHSIILTVSNEVMLKVEKL
uniref:Cytochrome P450 n=1 Tax=Stomoxys calcitrans TaxID=35570 RepID=A0A1I8Q363_STOCA